MKPIIEVEGLTKVFKLGSTHDSYLTLRDTIRQWFHPANHNDEKRYVKALDNVSFSVHPGEKIGVIGKNGAGKSTLLKILSRITPPTGGRAILRGKVASLLEVGTGFHGELTGRENIFLNGAILGMKRNEIKKKLDEIVYFSGVERFLDTPLKHYSSGMQVRLAFAVAANLDSEILLVDEVLAVGDAEFQKKSLGKMDEISNSGRTIFFVSHNMTAIKSLCNSSVVLNQGKIEYVGKTEDAISFYINEKTENYNQIKRTDPYGHCYFKSIYVKAKNKKLEEPIELNDSIEITTEIEIYQIPSEKFHITYSINNALNDTLFTVTHWTQKIPLKKGNNKVTCIIPENFLNIGTYTLNLYLISNFETLFSFPSILKFIINEGKEDLGNWFGKEPGYILTSFNWNILND
ncbi:MAG TPA: ABC transporter ATP-binding protein [Bacteroidales bacterium]|nr:ABC transporter ATP-binding protein [Bacteroidales bacterium]